MEDAVNVRVDARPRLWFAALAVLCSIAAAALGFGMVLAAVVAGPLTAAFFLWALWLLATFAQRRATVYAVGPQRIEIERGILGKRVESVDLFRVRDVVFEQSLVERMRGVGRITVFSSDHVEPTLQIGPVRDAKWLYTRLRDAVSVARKDARVLPVDAGG